jgi:hypothetical protein
MAGQEKAQSKPDPQFNNPLGSPQNLMEIINVMMGEVRAIKQNEFSV